jgi:small-conductance mechanosensitive channel
MNADQLLAWLLQPTVVKMMAALAVIVLARAVAGFVNRAVSPRVSDTTSRYRVRKVISFAGYATGLTAILVIFSDRLGGLTVAFGVAGAGVAFALQEVIASVAGWVAIMFGGFYRIGDRVQLGGIKGDVIDIGVIRTTLMEIGEWVKGDLYSGRIVRIANSFVFKEPVFNYSGDFPFLWDEIAVPITFGSDYEQARRILEDAAQTELSEFSAEARVTGREMVGKFAIEDARVDPAVTLTANDNWVELTLRYVVGHKQRRSVKDRLWTLILAGIDASSGRVAMASATFHLVQAPTFDVRLLSPLAPRVAAEKP